MIRYTKIIVYFLKLNNVNNKNFQVFSFFFFAFFQNSGWFMVFNATFNNKRRKTKHLSTYILWSLKWNNKYWQSDINNYY